MQLSWSVCKKRLAWLWFSGAGMIFLIVMLQTIFGRFGEDAKDAWAWLLPNLMPTLSLIIGVLVADALGKKPRLRTIDGFIFWLAFAISALYLVAVLIPILLRPFTGAHPIDVMKEAALWLAPFQGLVSASLGAFFIQDKKHSNE